MYPYVGRYFAYYGNDSTTMMKCDRCDGTVERVWRHREHGLTATHRVTRWLCGDCHPTAPVRSTGVETEQSAAVETKRSSEPVVTDGGTATACPHCAASTVNVHGIHDCTQCRWNSS